jgi:hypothetical protein
VGIDRKDHGTMSRRSYEQMVLEEGGKCLVPNETELCDHTGGFYKGQRCRRSV